MEVYLRECRENLKNIGHDTIVRVVLGSEACDLDSAISTLVFAYFLFKTKKSEGLVVPVLNVQRRDLNLHSEVIFFLEETSIPLDSIICKDEINLKIYADNNRLQVILVDHNVLASDDSYLEPLVSIVIDHHVAEHPERRCCVTKIELVGSCCTLIAEEVFDSEPSMIDPQIAMLLYGTILLDTVCLEESAKRTTQKDKSIILKLEAMLEGMSREEVFKTLQKAKFDVSGFSAEQLLKKDMKVVSSNSMSVAISSLPVLLENWLNDSLMMSALTQFCAANQIWCVVLMGSEVTGEKKSIRRQLAVFSPNSDFLEKLCDYLKHLNNPSLDLIPLPAEKATLIAFEQRNSDLSRKYVLPAVRTFLDANSDCAVNFQCRKDGLSLEQNSTELFLTENVDDYHTETLDFPDSPKHSNLLEISLQVQEQDQKNFSKVNSSPTALSSSFRIPCTENETENGDILNIQRKRILVTPDILRCDTIDDDQKSLSSLSNKSDVDMFSPIDDIILPDDIDTLEDLENSECLGSSLSEPIPEISAAEEYEEERSWKSCVVNGEERKIDMKVIEPYKKVLSHGGYNGSSGNAIIIFCACYLPDRSRKDYEYVMDNLFLYVLITLDQLVAEDYILVYLHGATEKSKMPSFGWLRRCYQMIDRRLRKNLKGLFLVHPTFWLKTIVIMTRPFISSKFSKKLQFVNNLEELSNLIPMEHVHIPDKVKQFDEERCLDS